METEMLFDGVIMQFPQPEGGKAPLFIDPASIMGISGALQEGDNGKVELSGSLLITYSGDSFVTAMMPEKAAEAIARARGFYLGKAEVN